MAPAVLGACGSECFVTLEACRAAFCNAAKASRLHRQSGRLCPTNLILFLKQVYDLKPLQGIHCKRTTVHKLARPSRMCRHVLYAFLVKICLEKYFSIQVYRRYTPSVLTCYVGNVPPRAVRLSVTKPKSTTRVTPVGKKPISF